MSDLLHLEPRTFPSRIADLGFTVQVPRDWISHELPAGEVELSDPTKFVPLAVVIAPHSALILAFAGRPAYENGTLHDWALYLLEHNQLKPRTLGVQQVGSMPAIVGEAAQESEMGPMLVRFAFCEDGGRLLNLSLSAPELLADSVRAAWLAALESFTLTVPRGSTVRAQPEVTYPAGAAGPVATTGPREDGQPEWWHRAVTLESAGRLEDAENAIMEGANHIGGASSVAMLYARRLSRLKAAGENAGAVDAFRQADKWMGIYASQATSGGEGEALSREHDEFRAELVRLLGKDPER